MHQEYHNISIEGILFCYIFSISTKFKPNFSGEEGFETMSHYVVLTVLGTHSIDQAGPEIIEIHLPLPPMCAITPGLNALLISKG